MKKQEIKKKPNNGKLGNDTAPSGVVAAFTGFYLVFT